jgi:hypothetical protein
MHTRAASRDCCVCVCACARVRVCACARVRVCVCVRVALCALCVVDLLLVVFVSLCLSFLERYGDLPTGERFDNTVHSLNLESSYSAELLPPLAGAPGLPRELCELLLFCELLFCELCELLFCESLFCELCELLFCELLFCELFANFACVRARVAIPAKQGRDMRGERVSERARRAGTGCMHAFCKTITDS